MRSAGEPSIHSGTGIARMFHAICHGVERALDSHRAVAAIAAVLIASGVLAQLSGTLNHDSAWYLYATGRFVDGARLYVDIIEVNPPLAFYLTVPAVLLARHAGLFPVHAFIVYVFGLIAVSLWLARHVLRRDSNLPAALRNGILLAGLVALAIYPSGSFGQREHLMLVLAFPYFITMALRARRVPIARLEAVAVGILAGIGFALKPHFFLAPAALELYLLANTRDLRGLFRFENVSLAASVLLYVASIALFTPEYLTKIVPYALLVYNDAYTSPLWRVVNQREMILLPVIVVMQVVTRRQQSFGQFGEVFSIGAVCFLAIYLMQAKGWPYQIYPASALWLLATVAYLPGLAAMMRQGSFTRRIRIMSVTLTGVVVVGMLWVVAGAATGKRYENPFLDAMLPIVRQYAGPSPIYIFSTNVSTAFPLVTYSNAQWSSRFPTLWLLPGLVIKQPIADVNGQEADRKLLGEIHRYLVDAVVADLSAKPPALIIVDARSDKPYFDGLDFDYIPFFMTDARFAEIWRHYQPLARYEGFVIFVRRNGGSP